MFGLSIYSNEKTVTETLKNNRIRLQPRVGGGEYLVDEHYRTYVFDEINNMNDAQAVMDKLNEDAKRLGYTDCTKAMVANSWFTGERKEFWTESASGIRRVFSNARRTHCACHETGSLSPRR